MKFVGLKACDTCRKARLWLDENRIAYEAVDVKKDGLAKDDLERYLQIAGLSKLVNKSSTTWRGLSDEEKTNLSEETVVDLLQNNPSLMKRPIFDFGHKVVLGFRDEQKAEVLSSI